MSKRPHITLTTPTLAGRKWVTDLVVSQGEALHEIAELTVVYEVPRGTNTTGWSLDAAGILAADTPVEISFGDTVNSSTYYGYVSSISVRGADVHQSASATVEVPVVYTCIGPTNYMQSQANRLWSSTTASYIARTLTRGASLRPQVQRTSRLFTTALQQATSDFAFLRDLADEVGYRMIPSGTTLSFTDPLVSLRETGEDRPAFRYAKSPTDTVKSWSSTAGQLDPLGGTRTRREGYSFNTTTKALVRVVADGTQDANVTQYSTGRPFTSQAEAAEMLSAEARRERLWVHAAATVIGDSRVRPGTELEVSGGALGPEDAGQWMVRSATHRISVTPNQPAASAYWTDVTLGRNRTDGLDAVPMAGQIESIAAGTSLINGRWRAQHIGRP
ncbi:contractile injection system protein, VgrG/Pvc8 family [Streptomyces sp. BH105]|uniref:contractile injection system protein, VgrG/Pvc8 family n=1 Tax=Streptomyces sp. BH105 TaxID=3410408 RepID=UPI003CE7C8B7